MKKIFMVAAILAAGVMWSMQANKPVTLMWDNPSDVSAWVGVRIYDNGVQVAEVACSGGVCPNQVAFTMARAAHSFTARSYDANWESDDSNVVIVNGPPVKPGNLRKQ